MTFRRANLNCKDPNSDSNWSDDGGSIPSTPLVAGDLGIWIFKQVEPPFNLCEKEGTKFNLALNY